MPKSRRDIWSKGSQEILRVERLPMPLLSAGRRETAGDGSAGRVTQATASRQSPVFGE